MLIQPDAKALLSQSAESGAPKVRDLPPETARQMMVQLMGALELPPLVSVTTEDLVIPGPMASLGGRLYLPREIGGGAVIAYFHGGGWVVGGLDLHDSFCRYLADRLNLRVVSVDYRLAPEHPFPAAYDDGIAAVQWLLTSPRLLGRTVEGVGVAGDSSGANIAAGVSGALSSSLQAQLLFYPATDISRQTESYATFGEGYLLERADVEYFSRCYVPDEKQRSDPRVSPLFLEQLDHVPPAVILTCGLDVLRDEGRAYAAKLVSSGVTVIFREAVGLIHGLVTLRGVLPSAIPVLNLCIDDFGRLLNAPAASARSRT